MASSFVIGTLPLVSAGLSFGVKAVQLDFELSPTERPEMARGRKSGISLTVVPPALPGERPAPPAELDAAEQRIWNAIVGALPPLWLDAAAQEILTRAVAQAGVCEGQTFDRTSRPYHSERHRKAKLERSGGDVG